MTTCASDILNVKRREEKTRTSNVTTLTYESTLCNEFDTLGYTENKKIHTHVYICIIYNELRSKS